MTKSHEQPDELQGIWQSDKHPIEKENLSMIMHLIQEKRRSFFDRIHGENQAQYMLTLTMTPILALFAWKAHPLMTQIGYGLAAIYLAAGSAAIWLQNRRTAAPTHEQDGHAYCRDLATRYEERIRAVGKAHWFAFPPIVVAAALVVWPYARATGNAVLYGSLALLWFWGRHANVQKVRELKCRKQELAGLLMEMDRYERVP
jgi:hypothetical protein